MFEWLFGSSQLPVTVDERHWLENRFRWLINEFGESTLREATVVLPTTDFFPGSYDASRAELQEILQIVCSAMQVDRARLRLRFFEDGEGRYVRGAQGAHGLYSKTKVKEEIWISSTVINDPMAVVATMAHELAHAKLIGEKRLYPERTPDHEKLTDLTTVFFGLGIFTSNCVLREFYWDAGQVSGWQMERSGYLGMNEFGYALALFSSARGEDNAAWHRYLRRDVRGALKQANRYRARIESDSNSMT